MVPPVNVNLSKKMNSTVTFIATAPHKHKLTKNQESPRIPCFAFRQDVKTIASPLTDAPTISVANKGLC